MATLSHRLPHLLTRRAGEPASLPERWLGPAVTVIAIALIELLRPTALWVVNPPAILVTVVVWASFQGGVRPGLVSGILSWAYAAWSFSVPQHPFHYGHDDARRMVVWAVVMPALALMVGGLRQRLVKEERSAAAQAARLAQAEALHLADERFRATFHDAAMGMAILSLKGEILAANPAVERMLGWSGAELRKIGIGGVAHPEDQPACMAHLSDLASGHGRKYEMEKRYLHRDGHVVWANLVCSLVRDSAGNPAFMVAMLLDVTDRRRAEEERARSFEQATRAVRLRDDFIALASHELRTPITPLKLQVQFMRRLLRGDEFRGNAKAMDLVRLLDKSERQIEDVHQLVEAMLQTSEIGAGTLELEREPVDLGELTREVLARYGRILDSAGCHVSMCFEGDLAGRWDRGRLAHALGHLVTNAAKYGAGRPVSVRCWRAGERVFVSVQDHGIGIAPEEQARIFAPFERAVALTSFGGLGLGLYVARAIVEGHGGAIRVASTPGQGATFTIELPDGRAPAPSTPGPPA